jgi:hypothetical protein
MRRIRVALAAVLAVAAAHVPATPTDASTPEPKTPTLVDNAAKLSYPPDMLAPPDRGGVGVGGPGRGLINFVARGRTLGGYRLGYVPRGLTALGEDTQYTSVVTPAGLTGEPPDPYRSQASVSLRVFARASGGMALTVSVLRPDNAAQTRDWLLSWATGSSRRIDAFPTPAGPARLLAYQGSETTAYQVLIAPDDVNALIVIEGPSPAAEQIRTAQGIVLA